jgi:NAD+ kinase
MDMKTIAILYNPRTARAYPLAEEIAAWLEQEGRRTWIGPTDDAPAPLNCQEVELLVTLGGDGSILRAVQAAASYGAPILGINLGRVGFLTEAKPGEWRGVLPRVLEGDCWIEERMMLRAVARRAGDVLGQADALNDVVIGRGAHAHMVHLRVEVDGGHMTTYLADGLIAATPTGSTAYALAAGGPVLPPEARDILLVPVAPHLCLAQSVLLPEGSTVRIVVTDERPALLTADGAAQADLRTGDEVTVEASPRVARFARVRERTYFYKTLAERLVPQEPDSR